jgi:hypothetical protein
MFKKVKKLSQICQKDAKKNCEEVVKSCQKVFKSCQTVVKTLSKQCQNLFQKLPKVVPPLAVGVPRSRFVSFWLPWVNLILNLSPLDVSQPQLVIFDEKNSIFG